MTDLAERPDLYPVDDETPVITALVAVDGRLGDSAMTSIVEVKDVDAAGSAYLPFLAWERSVDVYEERWPEEVRRAVIEAAPVTHRQKGTRYAVVSGLANLRIDAEVVEWWQQTPRGVPYTFHVTAFAVGRLYDGALLDERMIRDAYAVVTRLKPVSRAFTMSVGALMPVEMGLAPVVTVRGRFAATFNPTHTEEIVSTALGLAPAMAARARIVAPLVPADTSEDTVAEIGMAPVMVARKTINITMLLGDVE